MENFESKIELSEQEKEYKEILENEGLIYLGLQEGAQGQLISFRTGDKHNWDASMSISVEDFNLESLRKKVQEIEKKFKK